MNTEMLSPELQLNNMLEQINAQLPNNKAQKASEIMNAVLGGAMLLRHVGFYKALTGLGDKVKKVASDVSSGESSVAESVINNVVPDALQPLARGVATALSGGGTQALQTAAVEALPDALQPLASGVTTAIQGGGTQALQTAATEALPDALQPLATGVTTALTGGGTQALQATARAALSPIVEQTAAPIVQELDQAPGFLDRMVSGIRDLGGRLMSRGNTIDDPAPREVSLDDPSMNIRMDDPFSEGPLPDLASRRGLFRAAPEAGEADSGQNIGNAFSQARAQGELPDLPVFDGMREVPQSSSVQEQQAAANRDFSSEDTTPEQQAPEQQAPEPEEEEADMPETQETEAVSAEEEIPATVATETGDVANLVAPEITAAVTPTIVPTVAKVTGDVVESGFEFGPIFEGAAILGAIVPQLVSLFEKPEQITASYVGDQIGL